MKAVLFDLDGDLIDSEPRHLTAFEEVFAELIPGRAHGLHLPAYIGRSDRAVWDDFIAAHQPAQSLAELTTIKQQRVIQLFHRDQPIFPEVPGLVAALAEKYLLAVASGSVHAVIREVLSLQGLARHFRTVASVEDVGRSKPAPDVFLHAAKKLGVNPSAQSSPPPALQDHCLSQDPTFVGLISMITGTALQEDIAATNRQLLIRGWNILGASGMPPLKKATRCSLPMPSASSTTSRQRKSAMASNTSFASTSLQNF